MSSFVAPTNLFVAEARQRSFSYPLHALRGIAAVIVLLSHIQMRINEAYPDFAVARIFNGSGAVTFFFVLSGLVVGAALAKQELTLPRVSTYLHRRFFRIMPLLFVTVSIGGIYLLTLNSSMTYSLYDGAYGDFSLTKFFSAYIGYSLKPNQPIWSIYIEIIASLFIPLMILTGTKIRYIIVCTLTCVLFSLIPIDFKHHWNFYLISFYIGLSILVWGKYLAHWLAHAPSAIFWGLVIALFTLFYCARIFTSPGYGELWIVYWETLTVAPLVALIYYLPERFSILNKPGFIFLGDISYSLYLTHWLLLVLILNATTALLGTTLWSAVIFSAIAFIASFVAAQISYRHIELNGIKLGEILRGTNRQLPGYSP
jgi:peptidoglycan/LPS O-acetylase OafA/YrhL